MILTCVTKHAFRGNPSERQVSFSAGERVIYDTAHNEKATQGGWVWVKLVSNPAESSGWCPQAYLTVPNEPPFTVTTNRARTMSQTMMMGFLDPSWADHPQKIRHKNPSHLRWQPQWKLLRLRRAQQRHFQWQPLWQPLPWLPLLFKATIV